MSNHYHKQDEERNDNGRAGDVDFEVPKSVKIITSLINRVGFPIVAFLLMYWVSYNAISKMDQSMKENTQVLIRMNQAMLDFQKVSSEQHNEMLHRLNQVGR